MQPCNRIYYSNVYWAAHRSSSGTLNCICSLWFTYTCGDRPLPSLSGEKNPNKNRGLLSSGMWCCETGYVMPDFPKHGVGLIFKSRSVQKTWKYLVKIRSKHSWFQTFAVFRMFYAFFWVIPWRLNFKCRSFYTYLPMKMEQTGCSETSAYKIQTPGNYPEESIK